MRILAIRGRNLASIEGDFEIDFKEEPLASSGIFAITGPTGSGKSTILDALCLALFDDTPRVNRVAEGVQIADQNNKMIAQNDARNILRRGCGEGYAEVDFVALNGENYCSRWSVRRARDKADGAMQSSSICITNLNRNEQEQGTKTELLAKIVQLIGLKFDQFTRAVLLAQGDFATFLKARQSEKAELLEKLTGTEIYSVISKRIYDCCKEAEQEVNMVRTLIQSIALLTEEQMSILSTEQQTLIHTTEGVKNEVELILGKLKWVEENEKLHQQKEEANAVVKNTRLKMEESASRFTFLEKVDRVQAIRDSFLKEKETLQLLRMRQKQVGEQQQLLGSIALQQDEAMSQMKRNEVAIQQFDTEKRALAPIIVKARELDVNRENINNSLKESDNERKRLQQSISTITISIQKGEQRIDEINRLTKERQEWFLKQAPYKEMVPRVDLVIALLDTMQNSNALLQQNASLKQTQELALRKENENLTLLKAEQERLNTALPAEIAQLRAYLKEDEACPVCGSLDHPFKGVTSENILLDEEIERSKKKNEDAILHTTETIARCNTTIAGIVATIEGAQQQATAAESKVEVYLSTLPQWRAVFGKGQLQEGLRRLSTTWNQYTDEVNRLREEHGQIESALKVSRCQLEEIISEAKGREERWQEWNERLNRVISERREMLQGRPVTAIEQEMGKCEEELKQAEVKLKRTVDALLAKSEGVKGQLTTLQQEVEALHIQNEALAVEVKSWIETNSVGMTGEELAMLLERSTQWITAERKMLIDMQNAVIVAQATVDERIKAFEQHQLSPLHTKGEDKVQLQELLIEKKRQGELQQRRLIELEGQFVSQKQAIEKSRTLQTDYERKEAVAENWRKLNLLFGSATGNKFKEIAQAYTLDALLGYANKHLEELSPRYCLERIPDTLALQVVDQDMMGEVRTVLSLSGGESFLISLALALGLSSLSSNRMRVESLFIDEGFGSLDIDTLRIAMEVLESLHMQGRKIGVISHVAEMTERITAQIQVIKVANGKSRIEVVG